MTLLGTMAMHRILSWLPFVVFLWSGIPAEAQRDRAQDPAHQRKAQLKMKREREKQQESAFREGRKAHWKMQDKSTRKRWRAQRREAKRMRRGGGPDSWYKGLFRSGRPIPWTRRAANNVGNLFKRKNKRKAY